MCLFGKNNRLSFSEHGTMSFLEVRGVALSRDMIFSMEDILDVTLRKSSETSKSNDEVFTDLVLNEQGQHTSQPPEIPTAKSSSTSFDLVSSSNSPLQT